MSTRKSTKPRGPIKLTLGQQLLVMQVETLAACRDAAGQFDSAWPDDEEQLAPWTVSEMLAACGDVIFEQLEQEYHLDYDGPVG